MRRPHLTHFTAIRTNSKISIRSSISLHPNYHPMKADIESSENKEIPLRAPSQSLRLLFGQAFKVRIVGNDENNQECYNKVVETDSFGNLELQIPLTDSTKSLKTLAVYELSLLPNVELLIGVRIPINLTSPKKVVISDFDKTLVDTRYHTAKEVYQSISKSIDNFPTLEESVGIFKGYIEKGFQPFILTASPHFYESAIQDWLYSHKVFTAEIFLKDYRTIFSILEGNLTTKDIKAQGFYKLNHLVTILLMTGIPDELVLMGDGFESDPLIYLLLVCILDNQRKPWEIWQTVKKHKAFRLTARQDADFLNKLYLIQNSIDRNKINLNNIQIYIRRPTQDKEIDYGPELFNQYKRLIQVYQTTTLKLPDHSKKDGASSTNTPILK